MEKNIVISFSKFSGNIDEGIVACVNSFFCIFMNNKADIQNILIDPKLGFPYVLSFTILLGVELLVPNHSPG